MEWIRIIADTKNTQNNLFDFLDQYGISGLEQALQLYIDMQQVYTCRTRKSFSRIRMSDIYYLKISGHEITIYASTGTYRKYGTLSNELKILSRYGFIRCNQSYVVAISKIKSVSHNQILLTNGHRVPMSRNYAPKVIVAMYAD